MATCKKDPPSKLSREQVANEKSIPIMDAKEHLPYAPSRESLYRWRMDGMMSDSGDRVYLGWYQFGGRVMTTVEAVGRFRDGMQWGKI